LSAGGQYGFCAEFEPDIKETDFEAKNARKSLLPLCPAPLTFSVALCCAASFVLKVPADDRF
jgi:hypothetical protein